MNIQTQVDIPIKFKGITIDSSFIADIIVENKVIIEIKSISEITNVHHKQWLTYLKLTGLKLSIVVNFNTDDIDKSIMREINGVIN